MSLGWIDQQEDDLLRSVVAAMKNHDEDEWDSVWRIVYKQDEIMATWDALPLATLEKKFTVFWELIRPFAEAIAQKLASIGMLESGQMKRELQIGCLRGLREFDIEGRSTVSGWLRVAWQFQDDNVRRRKGQQNRMAASTVENEEGDRTLLVDLLPAAEDDSLGSVEQKDILRSVERCFDERTSSYPWTVAAAIWLDDASILADPDAYPAYPPRARQHIVRELASGMLTGHSTSGVSTRTNVFLRRHLWKSLSEIYIDTISTRGKRPAL